MILVIRISLCSSTQHILDLPSPSQVNEMRQKLFSSLEEDDDLDKTFQMLQSMRGKIHD